MSAVATADFNPADWSTADVVTAQKLKDLGMEQIPDTPFSRMNQEQLGRVQNHVFTVLGQNPAIPLTDQLQGLVKGYSFDAPQPFPANIAASAKRLFNYAIGPGLYVTIGVALLLLSPLIAGAIILYIKTGYSPMTLKRILWSPAMKGALSIFYVPVFIAYALERFSAPNK